MINDNARSDLTKTLVLLFGRFVKIPAGEVGDVTAP